MHVYNGRLGRFLRDLPCIIDKDRRNVWSIHDKDKEFGDLGYLLDDCEYALLFESSQLNENQCKLMVLFYARFEAFYQACDRLNECEEHLDWEGIVSVANKILEAFDYEPLKV